MNNKKSNRYIWYLIIGIILLIVPTAVYLGFLIPAMKDEYIVLMSSAGAIGGSGMLGTHMIPEKTKYGFLFKTASKSFTLLVVITLVQSFIKELIGLAVVMILSYIVFIIMRGLYKDGKQRKQSAELAEEVARSVVEASK